MPRHGDWRTAHIKPKRTKQVHGKPATVIAIAPVCAFPIILADHFICMHARVPRVGALRSLKLPSGSLSRFPIPIIQPRPRRSLFSNRFLCYFFWIGLHCRVGACITICSVLPSDLPVTSFSHILSFINLSTIRSFELCQDS